MKEKIREDGCGKVYICNTFTLGMLKNKEGVFRYKRITLEEAIGYLKEDFESAVGHQATAELLSELFGIEIPVRRTQIFLGHGDVLIVAQIGVRLDEGKILSKDELYSLLKEGKLYFVKVEVL